jgi:hypothetical protein
MLWFATALPVLLPAQWSLWAFVAFPAFMAGTSLVGGVVGTALRFYLLHRVTILFGK